MRYELSVPPSAQPPRRLVSTAELSGHLAIDLMDAADALLADPHPTRMLDGKVVVNAFFEPSTRTRLSFDLAARRLGADVLTLTATDASSRKGESLSDTGKTLEALGADVIVLRHPQAGAAKALADQLRICIVNGGDGSNDHPTQALVDAFTLRRHFGGIEGLKIVISGDIRHGRGAHANATLLHSLGAEVTLVAPAALRPSAGTWPGHLSNDLDRALERCDVVMLQRVQFERHHLPRRLRKRSFRRRYGLTAERAGRLGAGVVVMHPGPINRGIEIDSEVANGPRSLIDEQVANAVPVRMAVLSWLLQ
jgi:aspartate carbamoyltransferase catalytic subunit